MKKRALTLLEIMIVIFLITLITGTIGYNMRGTLDKGRAFRTERAKEQLHDLLLICLAESDKTAAQIASDPSEYLKQTGLAKDPKGLILDGWKEPFKITVNPSGTDFNIKSDKLIAYNAKTKRNEPGTEPASTEEE
jgi:general secretion pathway protein G